MQDHNDEPNFVRSQHQHDHKEHRRYPTTTRPAPDIYVAVPLFAVLDALVAAVGQTEEPLTYLDRGTVPALSPGNSCKSPAQNPNTPLRDCQKAHH